MATAWTKSRPTNGACPGWDPPVGHCSCSPWCLLAPSAVELASHLRAPVHRQRRAEPENSAALGLPISFVFYPLLMIFTMMAATVARVAAHPDDVLFITTSQIGAGVVALAAVVVVAATMGNVGAHRYGNRGKVANALVGDYLRVSDQGKNAIAKVSIAVVTMEAGGAA